MKILHSLVAVALVLVALPSGHGQQPSAGPTALSMSPELLALFREEMRELLSASQAIGVALPTGDWTQISAISDKMRSSYILERQLNEAQREELDSLPEGFKRLDRQFHLRAERLGHAATQKNVELTSFYFARLLEDCAGCHAIYAPQRFPDLVNDSVDERHQH